MNFAIGNDSVFTTASSSLNTSNNTSKLEAKLNGDIKGSSDKELMDVCKSFESYFVEQVFKEMKKTVPKSEESNEYLDYFGDKLYQEYAGEVTESGDLGIAQMLYESMKRNK